MQICPRRTHKHKHFLWHPALRQMLQLLVHLDAGRNTVAGRSRRGYCRCRCSRRHACDSFIVELRIVLDLEFGQVLPAGLKRVQIEGQLERGVRKYRHIELREGDGSEDDR